jgi:hypothetical protein
LSTGKSGVIAEDFEKRFFAKSGLITLPSGFRKENKMQLRIRKRNGVYCYRRFLPMIVCRRPAFRRAARPAPDLAANPGALTEE